MSLGVLGTLGEVRDSLDGELGGEVGLPGELSGDVTTKKSSHNAMGPLPSWLVISSLCSPGGRFEVAKKDMVSWLPTVGAV